MTNELVTELERLFQDYGGRGRRFPEPVKSRLSMMIQSGVSISSLSRATGMSVMTLDSWKDQSVSKKFQKISVDDTTPLNGNKFRLYIDERAWLELDEASISAGIPQKVRAAL
jgi:hypothetical protein